MSKNTTTKIEEQARPCVSGGTWGSAPILSAPVFSEAWLAGLRDWYKGQVVALVDEIEDDFQSERFGRHEDGCDRLVSFCDQMIASLGEHGPLIALASPTVAAAVAQGQPFFDATWGLCEDVFAEATARGLVHQLR